MSFLSKPVVALESFVIIAAYVNALVIVQRQALAANASPVTLGLFQTTIDCALLISISLMLHGALLNVMALCVVAAIVCFVQADARGKGPTPELVTSLIRAIFFALILAPGVVRGLLRVNGY